MLEGHTIGVAVPAYNEEKLITQVLQTMPDYVDRVVVVDDCSQDCTSQVVEEYCANHADQRRILLLRHEVNQGVGAAIVTGYKQLLSESVDVAAVMAGDAQMDPDDLPAVVGPVMRGEADYVKGNRLFTGDAWKLIPRYRYLGNSFLSLLTKVASGYWHVADSQTGYTAVSCKTLALLDLDRLYLSYGYPNHLLTMLNVINARVKDVPVTPVYNIGEKSGIRLWKVIPRMSWLLFKCFLWRMKEKYVIRDFHPLVFFYTLAFGLLFLCLPLFVRLLWVWWDTGNIPKVNALALMFGGIAGLQSLFFAMWFDMEYNRHLR
jgi:glycosyltransferase involved in cell wall biosynthesis